MDLAIIIEKFEEGQKKRAYNVKTLSEEQKANNFGLNRTLIKSAIAV